MAYTTRNIRDFSACTDFTPGEDEEEEDKEKGSKKHRKGTSQEKMDTRGPICASHGQNLISHHRVYQ